VTRRALQTLPVTGEGAIYRILVKATVPGTRRGWRELVVSELRVMGDSGRELRAQQESLQVAIGGLDNASPEELRTRPTIRSLKSTTPEAPSENSRSSL
jgi:hypothetical protein